jgi:hypothetical protein
MIQNDLSNFFQDAFSDKRINIRATLFLTSLIKNGSAVINKCFNMHSDKISSYRLLNNKKCDIENISKALYKSCVSNMNGEHFLCLQDTTELNYSTHSSRINNDDLDIGPCSKNKIGGYFCHPMLVVDANKNMPIGFSSIKLWNRSWDKQSKKDRKYNALPIKEKESNRWISSVVKTREIIPTDSRITIVGDRESDIYEALCSIPDINTHLLIRSSSNRILCDENTCLLDKMRSCEIKHTYEIQIKGNKSRKSRVACIDLRFTTVDIKRPKSTTGDYQASVHMQCIYVVEQAHTVPKGEEPIEWRLLTSHEVDSIEQAMQCVQWYRSRWYIEELFRLLKTQGLDIEASQLEQGKSLKKLMLFSLQAALQLMIIKISYDNKDEKSKAKIIFSDEQIKFMKIIQPTLEGKTEKQKNPFISESLIWAAWIIAKLGKWSGYSTQSPPGYITMKNGMDIFHLKYDTFLITCQAMRDVYKE